VVEKFARQKMWKPQHHITQTFNAKQYFHQIGLLHLSRHSEPKKQTERSGKGGRLKSPKIRWRKKEKSLVLSMQHFASTKCQRKKDWVK